MYIENLEVLNEGERSEKIDLLNLNSIIMIKYITGRGALSRYKIYLPGTSYSIFDSEYKRIKKVFKDKRK